MRLALTILTVLSFQLPSAAQTPTPELVRILSGKAVMFGSMFIGNGPGPRPTIILLHGHPGGPVIGRLGTQSNVLELAQPLQQAGFNVLAFNYRGAWGSAGTYGLVARIEDVKAALIFVKSEAAARYSVDPAHLMVVGHSFGGFNALLASVEETNLTCTVGIAPANLATGAVRRAQQNEPPDVNDPIPGLSGVTRRELRQEIVANQPRIDVASQMSKLKERPLLIVQAKQDETVSADDVGAYVGAARAAGVSPFDHILIDANHNFTLEGNRKELASVVVGWMTKHCK